MGTRGAPVPAWLTEAEPAPLGHPPSVPHGLRDPDPPHPPQLESAKGRAQVPCQCDLGWSPFLSACGQDGIWAAHAALGLCALLLEGPLAGPEGGALGTELLRRRPLRGSTVPAPQAQAASPEAAGPE